MSLLTSVATLACNPSPGEVEAESGPFNTIHEFKASLDHIDTRWATLRDPRKERQANLFCM